MKYDDVEYRDGRVAVGRMLSNMWGGRFGRTFLFRCDGCDLILSVNLDDKDDVQKTNEGGMFLECPCGGHCNVLPN